MIQNLDELKLYTKDGDHPSEIIQHQESGWANMAVFEKSLVKKKKKKEYALVNIFKVPPLHLS